jgi:hypothetical protein
MKTKIMIGEIVQVPVLEELVQLLKALDEEQTVENLVDEEKSSYLRDFSEKRLGKIIYEAIKNNVIGLKSKFIANKTIKEYQSMEEMKKELYGDVIDIEPAINNLEDLILFKKIKYEDKLYRYNNVQLNGNEMAYEFMFKKETLDNKIADIQTIKEELINFYNNEK